MRISSRGYVIVFQLLLAITTGTEAVAQDGETKAAARPGFTRAATRQDTGAPTEVLPANLQLTVYELQTTPEQASKLNATTLTNSAATAESLLEALAVAGNARILYRIDQPVNVLSDRIQTSTKEGVITGSRLTDRGQAINTISYQTAGLIVQLSGAKVPSETAPSVAFDIELATLTPSARELAPGHRATTNRSVSLKHSELLKFGQPAAMLSVSSASAEDATSPMVYVIRYLFTAPPSK